MKYFTRIVLIAIILFAGLFNQQAYSQCGEVLDQKQESFNLGTMGSDQWQSFTSGQSGLLTKLQLFQTFSDNCPGTKVYLKAVSSNQPDNGLGDGDTPNDIQHAAIGTADFKFDLRKERSGKDKRGRTYTIVYEAVDASGNKTEATAYVYVPHSLGKMGTYGDEIITLGGAALEVYPNPTSDNVNINFLSEVSGDIELRLMNLAGMELMNFGRTSVSSYDNILNLSDYPAGVYLLEVKFNYETKVIKIIKY